MLLKIFANKWIYVILGLMLLCALIASAWVFLLLDRDTLYDGIIIEGLDVSGLTRSEAKSQLEARMTEEYINRRITLKCLERSWGIGLSEISFRMPVEEAVRSAYDLGRKGSLLERLKQIMVLRDQKQIIRIKPEYDRKNLQRYLKTVKAQVDAQEKDASVSYKTGIVAIEPEVVGKEMDIDTNMKIVENYILRGDLEGINLAVKDIPPRIRYDDIKDINTVISSFSTTFNPGDSNRSHNIRLACERINNSVLMVNDIFSMNRALGPRTAENGYKEAPVIYKNELIKGPGGGVCQVTTTLYVAVLKARLGIIERSPHSMPLGYVDPGQDATIAEGSIDFKFQNSLSFDCENYPVFISAEVSGNRIIIRVLGRKTGIDHVVKLKSTVLREYPPEEEQLIFDDSVPKGEKKVVQNAKKGYKVVVFREVYSKNGELLDREKISEDLYRPVRAQVKVNPEYFEFVDQFME